MRKSAAITAGMAAALAAGIWSSPPLRAGDLVFPSDAAIAVTRLPDQLSLMPHGEISVHVTITNNTTSLLRGIYYTEHIPAVFTVQTDSVSIDGGAVGNYIYKTSPRDIYSNTDAHRWIIEEPGSYEEMNNPLPPGGTLTISFRISTIGYFHETWVPYLFSCEWPDGSPPAAFGYCEETLTINSSDDTDGDGLSDEWEYFYFSDLSRDGFADDDADGLTDLEEHDNGSDPRVADSDGDGMDDGWEVYNGFDPVGAFDASEDADADGLSNAQEYAANTDPHDVDSDADDLEDYDEIVYDGNADYDPYDPISNPTGTDTDATEADTDGDGFTDYIEINSESSPISESVRPLRVIINFCPPQSYAVAGICPCDTNTFSPRGFGWQYP